MLYDKKWETQISEPEIENKSWRTLLLQAADAIERDGWTRNQLYCKGRMCMMGAIEYVDSGKKNSLQYKASPEATQARVILGRYLQEKYGTSIPGYNDCFAKSRKAVLRVMRKVANREYHHF
jgi:hypothetical protein